MTSFLGEIRRRKVFQVAAVYAVVAWLIIQVVGAINEPLSLPDWVDTVVIVLLGVGFPIAIIFAWVFDITPDGIRATPGAEVSEKKARSAGQPFSYISQGLVLVAVGFLVADQYLLDDRQRSLPDTLQSDANRPVNRFEYRLPDGQELDGWESGAIAISPDGRSFVYSTEDGLYLRPMDALEARLLEGARGPGPDFSPDGQSIVYRTQNEVQRVPLSGGTPIVIAGGAGGFEVIQAPRFSNDGDVLMPSIGTESDRQGIYRIPAAGGEPTFLVLVARAFEAFGPSLLPDGDTVLFSQGLEGANTWVDASIVVQSLATGEQQVLIERGRDARYLPGGYLVYARDDSLYGVGFDAETLGLSGTPVEIVTDLLDLPVGVDVPAGNFDVADDGTLVYLCGSAGGGRSRSLLTWVDRMGNEQPLGFEPRIYTYPRLSPDETRIAFAIREAEVTVWVGDLMRRTMTRPTLLGDSISPVWSPDGSQLYFGANLGGELRGVIVAQRADGSVAAEPLLPTPSTRDYPRSISADGRILLVSGSGPPRDIGMLRLDDPMAVEPLVATSAEEISPDLSPDGRWLAYDSNESGRFEIYVRPFPNVSDSRLQISVDGGRDPLFSRDGSELFYWVDPGTIMSVPIEYGDDASFNPGLPRVVVQGDYLNQNVARQYDVTADGQRFVVLKRVEEEEGEAVRVVIVQNFVEELKRRVASN